MPKPPDKSSPAKNPEGFRWELKPEPRATPRDRRWLMVSVTALVVWLAALGWLAYR
jgi:hypothetical protein